MAPGRDITGPSDQLDVGARPTGHNDLAEFCDETAPGYARERRRTVHGKPPSQQTRRGRPALPSSPAGGTCSAHPAARNTYFILKNSR